MSPTDALTVTSVWRSRGVRPRGRSHAGRIARALAVSLAVCGAVLASAAVAHAQADGRVDVAVQPGYLATTSPGARGGPVNALKANSWCPLRVGLRNYFTKARTVKLKLERPLEGTSKTAAELTQTVSLSPRPQRGTPVEQSAFFLLPPVESWEGGGTSWTLLVTDEDENSLLRYFTKHKIPNTSRFEIVWHTQDRVEIGGGMAGVRKQFFFDLAKMKRDTRLVLQVGATGRLPIVTATTPVGPNKSPRTTRLQLTSRTLAEVMPDWLAYQMLDALVVVNPKWSEVRARPQLWESWTRWVAAGGHLILVLSERAAEYNQSPIPGFARVVLGEGTTYPRVGSGSDWFPPATPLPGLSLRPAESGGRLLWPGCVQAHYGLGTITTFGFDVTSPVLTGWNSESALAGDVLRDHVFQNWRDRGQDAIDTTIDPESGSAVFVGAEPREAILPGWRKTIHFEKAAPVAFVVLAMFIGVYVLVIGPLDYLVLKKLDKLTWTWLTFTVAVFAFFLFANTQVENLKGGDMLTNQITFLDFGEGDVYRGATLTSYFSQSNGKYEIWLPDQEHAAITRLAPGGGYGDSQQTDHRDRETAIDTLIVNQETDETRGRQRFIKALKMPIWHVRTVHATWVGTQQERLRATLVDAGDEKRAGMDALQLDNGFDFDFEWVVVLHGALRFEFNERLPAGESATVPLYGTQMVPGRGVAVPGEHAELAAGLRELPPADARDDLEIEEDPYNPGYDLDGNPIEEREPTPDPSSDDSARFGGYDMLQLWTLGVSTRRNLQLLNSPPKGVSRNGPADPFLSPTMQQYHIELRYHVFDHLDLSPQIDAGAIVVLAWSNAPTHALEVGDWIAKRERTGTLVRLIVWP